MSNHQNEQANKDRMKSEIVALINVYHEKFEAYSELRQELGSKIIEAYNTRDKKYLNGCLFNQVAEEGANGSAQEFYEENVANLRELLQEWDDATPFSIKGAYNLAKQSLKIIEGRTQRLECAVHRVEQVIEKAPESAGHRARLDKRPTFEIADPAVKTYEIVETPAGHYPNNKGRNGRPILSAKR